MNGETPRVRIAPEILRRHPDYKAVVLYARHLASGPSTPQSLEILNDAAAEARKNLAGDSLHEHPHLDAWRKKYSSFGCGPRRARCSAEALLERCLKKGLAPIHRMVDVYNAVSIKHVVPVGGEDLDRVLGDVVLRFSTGNEVFVGSDRTGTTITHPEREEVIWVDGEGVTCRRWNWRQCSRTALTEQSVSAYFVLEAVAPFGWNELRSAAESLETALAHISPGCVMVKDFMDPPGSRVPETAWATASGQSMD